MYLQLRPPFSPTGRLSYLGVGEKGRAGRRLRHVRADAKLPAPQTVTNRRIDVASQGERIPPPLAMMFTMPADAVRTLAAPGEQGWFVVKVDEVKKGDLSTAPAMVESTRAQFNQLDRKSVV